MSSINELRRTAAGLRGHAACCFSHDETEKFNRYADVCEKAAVELAMIDEYGDDSYEDGMAIVAFLLGVSFGAGVLTLVATYVGL